MLTSSAPADAESKKWQLFLEPQKTSYILTTTFRNSPIIDKIVFSFFIFK